MSASICRAQRRDVHAQVGVGRDPADRRRCRGPTGRRPSGSRCASPPRRRRAAGRPTPPATPCSRTSQPAFAARAARKQTKFAMLPPLTSSPPQSTGIADQLGDPAHGLRLDLGGGRRERPGADVRVDRRGEQVGEHADRRRRRGDVAEEARVPVEQRVLEQQLRRLARAAAPGPCPVPAAGRSGRARSRTADGDSSRVTGPCGSDSRNSAT